MRDVLPTPQSPTTKSLMVRS